MDLYIRKWKLSIETWRGDVIEVTDPLRVTFRIEKNINQIYQFAEITLYNLSPETETDIFANGRRVTLEAGYESGPYGVIFAGPIRQPVRGKEDSVTYYLKLVCLDGDDALNLGFVSLSIGPGYRPEDIAKTVARSSSVPFDLVVNPGLSQQRTKRVKVINGKPGDTIDSIAKDNNAKYYFDNGSAYLMPINMAPPANVPEMNAGNGMIGIPHQTDRGVEFRCLINPNLTLNNWVKINNRSINQAIIPFAGTGQIAQLQAPLDRDGLYRIIEMVIDGDSRGQSWYYDLTCVNQNGGLPAMLSDSNQNSV